MNASGGVSEDGPPTTLGDTGVDTVAFLQGSVVRDTTYLLNGTPVGSRDIFTVRPLPFSSPVALPFPSLVLPFLFLSSPATLPFSSVVQPFLFHSSSTALSFSSVVLPFLPLSSTAALPFSSVVPTFSPLFLPVAHPSSLSFHPSSHHTLQSLRPPPLSSHASSSQSDLKLCFQTVSLELGARGSPRGPRDRGPKLLGGRQRRCHVGEGARVLHVFHHVSQGDRGI